MGDDNLAMERASLFGTHTRFRFIFHNVNNIDQHLLVVFWPGIPSMKGKGMDYGTCQEGRHSGNLCLNRWKSSAVTAREAEAQRKKARTLAKQQQAAERIATATGQLASGIAEASSRPRN
jgi:hypothetical protein